MTDLRQPGGNRKKRRFIEHGLTRAPRDRQAGNRRSLVEVPLSVLSFLVAFASRPYGRGNARRGHRAGPDTENRP